MTFIPTPNTAKAVLEGNAGGVPIVNTLWFVKGSNYSEANLVELSAGLELWANSDYLPLMVTQYTLDRIICYDMSALDGPVWINDVAQPGTLPSSLADFQSVLSIKFGTANRGRSGRGGNRISPLNEAAIDQNVISTGVRSNWVTAFTNLNVVVGNTSVGSNHCIVSFQLNGVPLAQGNAQIVTSYTSTTGYVRTLKSRRQP